MRQVLPGEALQVDILKRLWIHRQVQRQSSARRVVQAAMHRVTSHIDITGASINRHHRLRVVPTFVMSRIVIIQHAIVTRVNHFHHRPLRVPSITATRQSAAHRPQVPGRPHILVPYRHHRRRCLEKSPEVEIDNALVFLLLHLYFIPLTVDT